MTTELDVACCVFAGMHPEPVSTSWDAAGRLMDALRSKIWFNLNAAPDYYKAEVAMDGCDPIIHRNKSGPMALALAVAALTKESH